MWFDNIPEGRDWTILWDDKVLCECGAIRGIDAPCPVCFSAPYDLVPDTISLDDGTEMQIPRAFRGAESRQEDYLYLQIMWREWQRSTVASDSAFDGVSERASIVFLFWTYFETRIERLLCVGLSNIPTKLKEDTLERYSSINARLERLYKVLYGITYHKDLKDSGYTNLAEHLKEVQKRRNDFIHGYPTSIDDAFVVSVVSYIEEEHEAWIYLFNKRLKCLRDQ